MPSALDILPIDPPQPSSPPKPAASRESADLRDAPDTGRDSFQATMQDVAPEQDKAPSQADAGAEPVATETVQEGSAKAPATAAAEAPATEITTTNLQAGPGIPDLAQQANPLSLGPVSIAAPVAATTLVPAAAASAQPVAIAQPVQLTATQQVNAVQQQPVLVNAQAVPQQQVIQNSKPADAAKALSTPVAVATDIDVETVSVLPRASAPRIDLAASQAAQSSLLGGVGGDVLQGNPSSRIAASLSASTQTINLAAVDNPALREAAQQLSAPTSQPLQAAPVADALAMFSTPTSSADPVTTQTPLQVQPTTPTAPTLTAQAPQLAQAMAQPPAQQLSMFIARGIREGVDRIEVQLHPAELGRVDVKMELGHDGRIMAVISAEKTETLEHLRRDIHALERALADAGFDADRDSFDFRSDDDPRHAGSDGRIDADADDTLTTAMPVPAAIAQRLAQMDGIGLDIRV